MHQFLYQLLLLTHTTYAFPAWGGPHFLPGPCRTTCTGISCDTDLVCQLVKLPNSPLNCKTAQCVPPSDSLTQQQQQSKTSAKAVLQPLLKNQVSFEAAPTLCTENGIAVCLKAGQVCGVVVTRIDRHAFGWSEVCTSAVVSPKQGKQRVGDLEGLPAASPSELVTNQPVLDVPVAPVPKECTSTANGYCEKVGRKCAVVINEAVWSETCVSEVKPVNFAQAQASDHVPVSPFDNPFSGINTQAPGGCGAGVQPSCAGVGVVCPTGSVCEGKWQWIGDKCQVIYDCI
ncbi:hypothetical protein BCR33DRAFT_716315 [Rhizoclosmatium globosum]|uniref:CBM1 domain-containing protein n=1 Tax=Rhizoclosmatium globosum TaxID=329046 RepID=A0A1Y2CF41_9FUNG|nr:hypothetical protein BCR33DRAFT_716315 [Rhizoclosmatium globosum]|eukprot:ORY45670.1 hypothetical protein BCR33DRAFT_716315 [Rhizoclosmatium globosum]